LIFDIKPQNRINYYTISKKESDIINLILIEDDLKEVKGESKENPIIIDLAESLKFRGKNSNT